LLIDPEIDLLSRRAVEEELPDAVVAEVRRAVFEGHRLRIHYEAKGKAAEWRTVDPIGLVTVREQGYLLATKAGEDRTYRLSRILAAEELGEPAQRPDRVDLDRAWQERSTRFRTGGDQVAVVLRVHPARREELVGTALAVLAEETDDGWLRMEVAFQDARHAEWALWQLSTSAEALEPQWLRAAVRDRAAAVADRYGEAVR
jgi:predicted DNA-binding transcriptional regulator YafY